MNPDWEHLEYQKMYIDGEKSISIYPLCECPEDAIIGRDLISCVEISELMERAYNAGLNKESFEVMVLNDD